MGFEDLEKELENLFRKGKCPDRTAMRQRIFMNTMEAFANEREQCPFFHSWRRVFSFRNSKIAFAVTSFFVLFNLLPGQSLLSEGEVIPKFGPVEIVRGENVILVENATKLQSGDIVRVGNNSEAEVVLPRDFTSTAKSSTQIRIVDRDTLFLEKGSIESNVSNKGEVSTQKGLIQSSPGSSFYISVSPSGETKIVNLSKEESVAIYDWKEGEMTLNAGEELRIRSETVLGNEEENFANNTSLSLLQIETVRNKLIIARTKLLTGVEKMTADKKKDALEDIDSAKGTFLSIVQVLDSSRNAELSLTRKNVENMPLGEVARALIQKTTNENLVTETKALERLFVLTEKNLSNMSFQVIRTGVTSFDRFVLLDHIASLGTQEESAWINILKQKYVASFSQKILNEEGKNAQIIALQNEIDQLPKNALAQDFLKRVGKLFPEELVEVVRRTL